jgi:Conjugal transfer protein TraD
MKRIRRPFLLLVCAGAAAAICSPRAWSQAYPTHTVRLIVSAAAGGPSDVIGRIMAQYLSASTGQQFYVDNIPAGAGNVAQRTKHLIELGGLMVKAGIVDLTGDDRTMIYGALRWMADKLESKGGEHARGFWKELGKTAFATERTTDAPTTS